MKSFFLIALLALPALAQNYPPLKTEHTSGSVTDSIAGKLQIIQYEVRADSLGILQNKERLRLDKLKRDIISSIDSTSKN